MKRILGVDIGRPLLLGARRLNGGMNFAIFSRNATGVRLELFDDPQDPEPSASFELDSRQHRTGDIWHIWIEGIGCNQVYAFQVDGPYAPEHGHRFNRNKVILDPYATALIGTDLWDFASARGFDLDSPLKDLSFSEEGNSQHMPKCLIADTRFDWEGDRPLKHSWSDTIIYETHVRGLTIHPSSSVQEPGTFLGLVEKIPHFKELGVTAVELMPVQEFNAGELTTINPLTGEPLRNYWGYDTVSFFAPKESYSTCKGPGCQVIEFKAMVKELHRAGIEVILDIVFNHTAEGNELGPTLNFRGLDNSIYYMLKDDRRFYRNYSGCGNTVNCNHPVVRGYILDCLRYWAIEMHVDGFRFDLASVLGRDENGKILPNPPLLESIAEDPILRDVKLIAEAWDAGGAYQVGSFPGQRWSEWNGCFRDDIRRFWHGEPGLIGALATRICGSSDLYQHTGKHPINSINFVTCHDGFTLNDLVSYKYKHNEANGEGNRDGSNQNYSDNHGIEGETGDPEVNAIRIRQSKNMLATLFVSRGVPMMLGGDEFRRTQSGNNNAYCQDNEISWYDWGLLDRNRELFRFTREIILFRKRHKVLRTQEFYTDKDIRWLVPSGGNPDWSSPDQALGCLIQPPQNDAAASDPTLCLLFNAEDFEVTFNLPRSPEGYWRLAVDTAASSPADIHEEGAEKRLRPQNKYRMTAKSMVILLGTKRRSARTRERQETKPFSHAGYQDR